LIYKSSHADAEKYNNYFYDFTYFLSNRSSISFDEIENLIQIFNYELDSDESEKIRDILIKFQPLQRYTLVKDGKIIDMNSKIDLEKIWK
jgi:excinuclease UvrABC nuclease subunit